MQRLRGTDIEDTESTERLVASSFVNLQLANRQLYHEASYILYQHCQFNFDVAPTHASLLDSCLLSGHLTLGIHDRSYSHRITSIELKANWHGCDRVAIRNFSWSNWNDITSLVCRELLGFSNLRRLTLDWRVPNPCEFLQPTPKQWLSISPYFEEVQAIHPHILVEVLAWQMTPGSIPSGFTEIRTSFETYAKKLKRLETIQCISIHLRNIRPLDYRWLPYVLPNQSDPRYSMPDFSYIIPDGPSLRDVSQWGVHDGHVLVLINGFAFSFVQRRRDPKSIPSGSTGL